MKKKIKLRDMTEKQYRWWYDNVCVGKDCEKCPFNQMICEVYDNRCWVYHKDMYSDKFLNQEIEINEETKLTENDRKLLEALRDVFGCDSMGITLASDNVACYRERKAVLYFNKNYLNCYNKLFDSVENEYYMIPKSINGLLEEGEE